MKRGEVWTMSGGSDYAGKPRPVTIVQGDEYEATLSATVCLLTSDPTPAPMARPVIAPSETNGLHAPSHAMVDKLTTVPKSKLGRRIGRLSDEDMTRLTRAMVVLLGIGASASR